MAPGTAPSNPSATAEWLTKLRSSQCSWDQWTYQWDELHSISWMTIQPIHAQRRCQPRFATTAKRFRHSMLAFHHCVGTKLPYGSATRSHPFVAWSLSLNPRGGWKMFRRAIAVLVCALAFATPGLAQEQRGSLEGTVKDAQGAVLPGAVVEARSAALIGVRSETTDANGNYRFPALPPGTYQVTAALSGFQTTKSQIVQLSVGQVLRVDVTLPLGGVTEAVQVTAESTVLDVASARTATTLTAGSSRSCPAAAPSTRCCSWPRACAPSRSQARWASAGTSSTAPAVPRTCSSSMAWMSRTSGTGRSACRTRSPSSSSRSCRSRAAGSRRSSAARSVAS